MPGPRETDFAGHAADVDDVPWPLATIPGASAATRKNGARTLLANKASNCSTWSSAVGPNTENPALLTKTSSANLLSQAADLRWVLGRPPRTALDRPPR